jgi:Domain of unknown function (DUF5060)/Protein of unknown function (DUF4038)
MLMLALLPLLLLAIATAAVAGTACEGTPAYSPCEVAFELTPADLAVHPNPYGSITLRIEFRSPRFRTYAMPAFWDGAGKMIVRFTPPEAGQWTYKATSNVASFDGQQGMFSATAVPDALGFVIVANVHHWATDNQQVVIGNIKPHLWMGYIADRFAFESDAEFQQELATAAENKFTHFRGSILGGLSDRSRVYLGSDRPNPAYFDELDRRIAEVHKRGITTDLMLAADPETILAQFPNRESRERFIRYVVARYAPFNVTWQGIEEFEDYPDGRLLLKELGLDLKKLDPYQHPRSSNAKVTSSPLLGDGWMDYVIEGSNDDTVGSVEHQFYQVPFVGVTDAGHLWNATMDGEYPEFRGGSPNIAKYWFDLMSDTRHWELEPYYDVDGARGIALEDVEYVNYIEHPAGPVEITVENHGYDVQWLDPATGESREEKKYKGEHFTAEAPDASHPWVLLVGREGHKEGMLKSYKFESRPVPVQEIETDAKKTPFEIAAPSGNTLEAGQPVQFSVKRTRETRATRSMLFLWTAEVVADGRGLRVLGTGSPGSFVVPASTAENFPAVLSVHVAALNAHGKAYQVDRVYQLNK